jgi:hypothetical protein
VRFDLQTREMLVLIAGTLGLIEQEAVRLLFALEPSTVLSGAFLTMVLAAIGVGAVRSKDGGGSE